MTKLGQHFLLNKKKIGKIIEALELKNSDVVIEIGPGHGELTNEVIKKLSNLEIEKFKIILIEKDEKLFNQLKEKFSENRNIEIIHGDALKILPKLITQLPNYQIANYKIVGNIPYYITGYLLRILGELITNYYLPITTVVLTIQKEVAQRVCSKPLKMNLLAASVQFWAEPKIIGYIPKKDFRPAPKVDSAIIKLTTYDQQPTTNDAENYYKFIKILFKQPRKTIINNLLSGIVNKNIAIPTDSALSYRIAGDNKKKDGKINKDKDKLRIANKQKIKEEIIKKLQKLGINPQARPQDLSIEQIIELSTLF